MNKVVKYGAIGLVSCVFLFTIALIVFVSTVDPNDYKDRIIRTVQVETGRILTFDGDLELLLFPQLGVSMGGVQLSNHEHFGPDPMISVNSARVTVRTLPLLIGQLKFGKLELNGLVLNMGRDAKGAANWDDLVGRKAPEKVKPETDQPFSLEVEGLNVFNGNVVWNDRLRDTRFTLHGMKLSTGRIAEGVLFPVDLTLAFECLNPDASGSLSLKCNSAIDFKNREYNHMDMHFKAAASGRAIPGGKVGIHSDFQFLAMNFNKGFAQVTGLELSAYGVTAHIDGTLQGLLEEVQAASGTIKLDPVDVKTMLAALGMDPLDTTDPQALTNVAGMVAFDFKPGRLKVDGLEADVDGARIVGNGRVERGENGPAYYVRLDVGSLDLDRYLPPDHPERQAASQEAAKDGSGDDAFLPTASIRRLDLDLEAKVAALKLGGARFTKVVAVVDARDGVVEIDPLSAEAYGGTVKLAASVDASGKTPRSRLKGGVEKMDIGALSRDVGGEGDYAGMADFSINTKCLGGRAMTMLETMNGQVGFKLTDGVFPGVDLVRITRATHTNKDKQGKVEGAEADSTRFGSITGTGTIKDGVLHNKDLEVKAPGLRASGHGAVSLVTRDIDYILKAKLVPQAEGQGGKSSDELFGVLVPIHVTGTLDKPYYWVSLKEYVKALGGVVVDTVGSVLGGVKKAVKGVGSALDRECCEEEPAEGKSQKKSKFLGIF